MKPSEVVMKYRELGIITLRPRRVPGANGAWQVAASTPGGGWGVVFNSYADNKEAAEFMIEEIVKANPRTYRVDDQAVGMPVVVDAYLSKKVIEAHYAAGVVTLRARLDNKSMMWGVLKGTHSNRWKRYGSGYKYYSKAQADEAIHKIVSADPEHYRADDGATEYVPLNIQQ